MVPDFARPNAKRGNRDDENRWARRVGPSRAGAMVFAPALALAGDLARKGQSGTQLSVLTMAFGLGTALGPLASGYLIRYS